MTDDPSSLPAILTGSSTIEGVVSLVFPIVAVIMGVAAVMMRMSLDHRRRRELFQLHHAERMAAIEKGIDVPPLPSEFFEENRRPTPGAYLYRGLLWLAIGVGLGIALFVTTHGSRNAAWSLVPIAIGVANLVYYVFAMRKPS
jgi:hypothetical protein